MHFSQLTEARKEEINNRLANNVMDACECARNATHAVFSAKITLARALLDEAKAEYKKDLAWDSFLYHDKDESIERSQERITEVNGRHRVIIEKRIDDLAKASTAEDEEEVLSIYSESYA